MKLTTIHNSILQITSVFSLSGALCLNAIAGSEVWTGAAGDNNWNTAGNWTGDNTPPAAGDIIAFGAQGAGSLMLNNNMTVDTSFAGLYFNATAPSFILTGNEITQTGATIDNSLNLETINLPITSTAAHSYGVAAGNTMLVGGVISGSGGGITKIMGGTLTLTNNNAYTGGTIINAGTLIVDYTGGAANNIVPSGSALTLGGGAIQIKGNSATSSSQTVNGATVNPGLNVISVSNNAATFNLGAFTQTLGSQTEFIGPAYDSNPTGGSATLVPATGTITTTTAGLQNNLLWPGSRVAVATVGLYEWASSVTTAGTRNVLAGSQQTGTFYAQVAAGTTTLAAADLNYDLLGNATANAGTALWYADTIRFNVPGAFTFTSNGGGTGHACLIGGILVTPNVGANNTTIASGGAWLCGPNASAGASAIDVYQNNTAGELLMNIPLYYYSSTARAASYVQAGAGTVVLSGSGTSSGNTGAPYLNGGSTVISANQQLGATATAATLNLNGGTLVAGANVSLDNGSGANKRPVALGSNGGGLAALGTGGPFTLTVSGVISGATGTGPLTIGIPASSANGNVVGQLPGTGAGTANTTATNATGTVILTANETYTGNTVISSGSLQLGAAATISNSASITVGSGATFDVSQVTGGFTLGPTVSQNLMGSGTVTGAVSVASGSGIYGGTDGTYGTNTFINNLTLSSGAAAYFDLGTSATGSNDEIVVQGTLTLNGNVIHVKAPGTSALLAPASYLLFSNASAIAGNTALSLVWDVAPVNSARYTLAVLGNNVVLQYASGAGPLITSTIASPNPAYPNETVLISATVVTNQNPTTSITADVSQTAGTGQPGSGATTVPLVLSATPNVYTNSVNVGASVPIGTVTNIVTAVDSAANTSYATNALSIISGAPTITPSVSPNPAGLGQTITISATVLGNSYPIGANGVSVDVSAIAGTSPGTTIVTLYPSATANVYTNSYTVLNTTAYGPQTLPVSAVNSGSGNRHGEPGADGQSAGCVDGTGRGQQLDDGEQLVERADAGGGGFCDLCGDAAGGDGHEQQLQSWGGDLRQDGGGVQPQRSDGELHADAEGGADEQLGECADGERAGGAGGDADVQRGVEQRRGQQRDQ